MIPTSPDLSNQYINELTCSVSPKTEKNSNCRDSNDRVCTVGIFWQQSPLTTIIPYSNDWWQITFQVQKCITLILICLWTNCVHWFCRSLYERESKHLTFYLRSNSEDEGRFCPQPIFFFLQKFKKLDDAKFQHVCDFWHHRLLVLKY